MNINYRVILLIIYAVPLARTALFFIPPLDSRFLRRLNAVAGRYEWLTGRLRDSLLFLYLLYLTGAGIYNGAASPACWYGAFCLLSIFSIIRKKLFARRMTAFASANPYIHPKEFFTCYYSGFGFIPTKLPRLAKTAVLPSDCSFKTGAPGRKALWPVIAGLFNTASMAGIIVSAFRWKGPEYAREVAEKVSIIWGARTAYLGGLRVKLEGGEKIDGLKGKCIFVFNHKSYLDFAVGPFALSHLHPAERGHFSFRFLAARDHFLDNPILYRVMGKAMQAAGTIFVDRKRKIGPPKKAALEASQRLANFDTDIVIFPQGTRAYGNIGADRRRLDSGYYTSGTKERLTKTGGHLKKGAAYIAADTAILLKKYEQSAVNIIPVGLIGTGLAAPKKSILIQQGTDIIVRVGNPIVIKGHDVAKMESGSPEYTNFVENIHARIDDSLKEILETHAWLEQRFFKDIRGLLPASDYEHVAVAMKAWRGKDYLIYTMLDCIYASDPSMRPSLLRELSYLMTSDAPHGTLMHFKARVIDIMIEGRRP